MMQINVTENKVEPLTVTINTDLETLRHLRDCLCTSHTYLVVAEFNQLLTDAIQRYVDARI